MVIFEGSIKFKGFWKKNTRIAGKKFLRFGFGWFAITITQLHLKEMHDYIAKGNTVWLDTKRRVNKENWEDKRIKNKI